MAARGSGSAPTSTTDPLPSWNDTEAKRAIVGFVGRTTQPGSPDFIPPAERIAVFDNDGTLWPEAPVPVQLAYAVDTLEKLLVDRPELKEDPLVQAARRMDTDKLLADDYAGLVRLLALTHAGMTVDEFRRDVATWIRTAEHPRYRRPYRECTYQPMRELLAYLRAHGFRPFIISGGGMDFMRVWAEELYGVPPEQVFGSYSLVKLENRSGEPVLVKTLESVFVHDREGKPVGIHTFVGRKPVMAIGNSDGDQAMLEYTTIGNPRPSFGLLVHHTDAEREYAYDAHPQSTGKLVEALERAPEVGWTVVDMRSDWKVVLPDDSVTAIDILLQPDRTMLDRAKDVNQRLLKVFPDGFPLDAVHRPHITLVQCFVRTAELEAACAAAEKVLAAVDLEHVELKAVAHYYIPEGGIGLAGIVIQPTRELVQLQRELLEAVKPFTVPSGGSSAFVTTPDDLIMAPALIAYVESFDSKASGESFNPHVTTGVAPRSYLDEMLREPFDTFSFSPAGAAVFQLGQYGTAAKELRPLT